MTKLLLSALKILLLVVLVAAAGLGAVLLADHMGWPRWVAAVTVLGLFFIIVLILFLRRFYFRRREAKFVKRVVEQDQRAIDAAPTHERRRLVELQQRWATAVANLRASRLNQRGDPLYSLPWFMIFGETASGKSTAVSHARLKNILTDAGPAKGIASTRNCDWWFFENAVILDSAGRYAVPLEDEDRGEWERFLTLLAKYRRKEPLNGLIVTLPADRLLNDDADALAEYGRSIRLRIDQLMRVLGAKFPVYLLITKIDLVLGMTAMADILPEQLRGQAMGLLNDCEACDPGEFLGNAIGHVSRRLKDLRLQLAATVGKAGGRAVLFPDEFERLSPGIRSFVDGAFSENPYQETPFLRGLFISSGRQSGLARSGVLGSLESFKDRQWRLPDTIKGLFLHDFFDAILPKDRGGYRPLGEYLSWRKATGNLALAAWLLLLLTGIGLAGFAYVHVRQAMEPVYTSFHQPQQLGRDLAQDMVTLGLLRDRISEMEQRLGSRVWSTAGFRQGNRALIGLKMKYCHWFRTYILNPTDEAMKEKFLDSESQRRGSAMAPYLEYLVWRVEILKAREADSPSSDAPGQAGPVQALAIAFGGRLPYVTAYFTDMYRSYAIWEPDPGILRREHTEMQVWANRIIEIEGSDLHWLTEWANTKTDLADVTLEDFWSGAGQVDHPPRVPRSFTTAGRAAIQKLIDQLSLVAADKNAFDKRNSDFQGWYAQAYILHWSSFARDFGMGMGKLRDRQDWMGAAAAMATMDNPYFKLITRMENELDAIRDITPHADLDRLAKEFVYIANSYKAKQAKATLEAKIADKIKRMEAHLERLDNSLAAAEAFTGYMQQLDAIVPKTATMNAAYHFSLQSYGLGSADGISSPIVLAQAAIDKMRSLVGKAPSEEDTIWRLVEGPLQFLVTLITYETACGINDLWQSQVVAETVHTPQRQLWDALFGNEGVADKFLSESAKPFLKRTRNGWSSGTWLGVAFPFRQEFLSFLDHGAIRRQQLQPKYGVSIATVPTDVNQEAKSEPYRTRLTLQCASGEQSLDNYNAPDKKEFTWEPASCDDVTLTIYFDETTLTHKWSGQWGFRDFLRAFKDGREVYTPKNFPQQQADLKRIGVRRIQVNYVLNNAGPVVGIEAYPTLNVPNQAANCWSGLGARLNDGNLQQNPSSPQSKGGAQ